MLLFLFLNRILERDSGSWNLEEEEVQRRRNIFWESVIWDCWAVSAIGNRVQMAIKETVTIAVHFIWAPSYVGSRTLGLSISTRP